MIFISELEQDLAKEQENKKTKSSLFPPSVLSDKSRLKQDFKQNWSRLTRAVVILQRSQ